MAWLTFCAFDFSPSMHGDYHEVVVAMTAEIEADPENPLLYYQRAVLHKGHYKYEDAINDYHKCISIDSSLVATYLDLADIHTIQNQTDSSFYYLAVFKRWKEPVPKYFEIESRLFAKISDWQKAIDSQEKSIALKTEHLRPEDITVLSDLFLSKNPIDYDGAIKSIEMGLEKKGNLISLREERLNLFIEAKYYDQALLELDNLINEFVRKEKWLIKKAEVYYAANRFSESKETFLTAISTIENLSPRFQKQDRIIELKKIAKSYLAKM